MTWHPILAAQEPSPGHWVMVDPDGREYGTITIVRVNQGKDVRYKATHAGQTLGYATNLRLATERVHQAYIASHGPQARVRAENIYPDFGST